MRALVLDDTPISDRLISAPHPFSLCELPSNAPLGSSSGLPFLSGSLSALPLLISRRQEKTAGSTRQRGLLPTCITGHVGGCTGNDGMTDVGLLSSYLAASHVGFSLCPKAVRTCFYQEVKSSPL